MIVVKILLLTLSENTKVGHVVRQEDGDGDFILGEWWFTLIEDEQLESCQICNTTTTREKSSTIRLPKQIIKTLLQMIMITQVTLKIIIRKQFVGTTNSSGAVSFSAGTNETFASFTNADYSLSILTAGGGTGSQGDLVDITG